MKLICPNKKCKNHKTGWNYKGKSKKYTCCGKCMYKVNIQKQLKNPKNIVKALRKKSKDLKPIKEVG